MLKHYRVSLSLLAILALSSYPSLFGQDKKETNRTTNKESLPHSRLHRARKTALNHLRVELAKAQRDGNESSVKRVADEINKLMGDQAGVPEVPDRFRAIPPTVTTPGVN